MIVNDKNNINNNNNNLINSNEVLNKTIYSIMILFFGLIVWFSKTLYNGNIELQNQMQEMSIVMNKLNYTIDSTNSILADYKQEVKEIKKDINKNSQEILILKTRISNNINNNNK